MRIIEINWYNSASRYAINADKIMSIDFDSFNKKIDICAQDGKSIFHITNKDMDKLKRIYENILDFCISTSDPNEIGYIPLLKIDIK